MNLSGYNTTLNLININSHIKSPIVAVDGSEMNGVLDGSYVGIHRYYTKATTTCNSDEISAVDLVVRRH